MTRNNHKKSLTRRLHRWIGAGASLFVIFMVLSGVLINHSGGFSLDQKQVSHPALLNWYGLTGPARVQSYSAAGHWLSVAGSQLYLDGLYVAPVTGAVGAVFSGEMFLFAAEKEVLLIDGLGRLIERQDWNPPGGHTADAIGLLDNKEVVISSGGVLWLADAGFLNWHPPADPLAEPQWSQTGDTPEDMLGAIKQHYRGTGLSVERVLIDLHSGRILGDAGILLYDLLAMLVGFLALSGLVMWVRISRKSSGKHAKT